MNYFKNQTQPKRNSRKTEDVLNDTRWMDGQGTLHDLESMEKDYLRSVLFYLYKNRDRYWINCEDAKIIETFENGEDFFQVVIRSSTLWKTAMQILTKEEQTGFNFAIDQRQAKREQPGRPYFE